MNLAIERNAFLESELDEKVGRPAFVVPWCTPEVYFALLKFLDALLKFTDATLKFPVSILKFPDAILKFPGALLKFPDALLKFTDAGTAMGSKFRRKL